MDHHVHDVDVDVTIVVCNEDENYDCKYHELGGNHHQDIDTYKQKLL